MRAGLNRCGTGRQASLWPEGKKTVTEKTEKEGSLGKSVMSSKAGELPPAELWRLIQRDLSGGVAGSSKG